MKKGINVWTMPAHLTIAEQIQLAEQAGYQTIEFNIAEAHEKTLDLSLETTQAELTEIKALIDQSTVKVESLSTALHWQYALSDNNPDIREKGKAIVKKMIDYAKFFGAQAVLVVPGLVTEEVAYDVCYERSLAALKELSAYAESREIVIGIENVENLFLMSPLEARDFVDEIASPYVRFYFDVGNALPFGYPEQWIKILGERIIRIHVKDFRKDIGNMQGFCRLLAGDVAWDKVMAALREIGYTGPLTCELSPYKINGELLTYETSRVLEDLMKL